MPRKTTEQFIIDARKIHGDRYNYSQVKYINSSTPVAIICNVHGVFFQRPNDHLSNHNCPTCAREHIIASAPRKSSEQFIEQAKIVHGDRYSYKKVDYINNKKHVTITCRIHGDYSQSPAHHLQGQSCPLCNKTYKLTTESFIKKASIVHNGYYSYSNSLYVNANTPISIICPIHGEFLQKPGSHLFGSGCKKCGDKKRHALSGSSQQEILILNKFNNLFPNLEIIRNYNLDERYPFACDFYVPERDLFIEYNGWWMHGKEWCDMRRSKSKCTMEQWQSKNSKQYKRAIKTYTIEDKAKRQTAKKNKLNYVVLWNEQDIEDWFAIGCPDGQDWDHEYSWKDTKKEV